MLQHLVPVLCGVWVGWSLGQVGGYIAFRAQLATASTGLGTLGREFTTLSRWVAHFLPQLSPLYDTGARDGCEMVGVGGWVGGGAAMCC